VLIYEPVMEGRFVPLAAANNDHFTQPASSQQHKAPLPATAAAAAAPAGPEEDDMDSSSSSSPQPSSKADRSYAPSRVALTASSVLSSQQQTASTNTSTTADISTAAPAAADGAPSKASAAAADSRAPKQQRMLRRLAALQATFAFSGLWHLMIFYYATGLVTPHWFLFFSVQVGCGG
jgi:hypothetical protein